MCHWAQLSKISRNSFPLLVKLNMLRFVVTMSGLKLLMSSSRILKEQKLQFFFRSQAFLGCGYLEKYIGFKGATVVDQSVTIELDPDHKLPSSASVSLTARENKSGGGTESPIQKAEDVVSSMLTKGFILGKDALNKAKAFDEKHRFTSTATATVTSLDQKIGFTEKISAGTTLVGDKVREMNEKFQVSEKSRSAFSAAGETASNAGSAIMKNRYVLTGASWVTGAFKQVTKAAGEVSQKAREKVLAKEEEIRKADGDAQVHDAEFPKAPTN